MERPKFGKELKNIGALPIDSTSRIPMTTASQIEWLVEVIELCIFAGIAQDSRKPSLSLSLSLSQTKASNRLGSLAAAHHEQLLVSPRDHSLSQIAHAQRCDPRQPEARSTPNIPLLSLRSRISTKIAWRQCSSNGLASSC